MSYELNPCEACIDRYKSTGCNVNDLSRCCYETLGAFMGSDNALQIHTTPQARNAMECVHNKIIAMGRDTCALRVAPKPIIPRAPHHFPELLHQSNNIEQSKNTCIKLCQNDRFPLECMANCITDANSVVPHEKYIPTLPVMKTKRHGKKAHDTYQKISKEHPIIFWVVFAIAALILALTLTIFYRALLSRQVGT